MPTRAYPQHTAGTIVAIPLPNGEFGYGRLFHDPWLGLYEFVSPTIERVEVVASHPISFFNSINDQAIQNGLWPIIGERPFSSVEDSWPPPQATMYSRNSNRWTMGGVPRMTHKGITRTATLEQVCGLDIATANPRPEGVARTIVDRLIHGNHAKYKVRDE